MRTLALSALALVIAAPAFAASPTDNATATYSMEVGETCTIDKTGLTDETVVLGTAVKMDITIDCNTEFTIAVAGEGASGAIELTNLDTVESSADYTDVITGSFTKAANTASNADVAGDYEADNDFDPEINVTFATPAVDLEAGNYEGDVTVTITGTDVTS